tara:strand:+ start:30 stop:155 length:126 start_codon:yes stop_codon:yes gene_type:complete
MGVEILLQKVKSETIPLGKKKKGIGYLVVSRKTHEQGTGIS